MGAWGFLAVRATVGESGAAGLATDALAGVDGCFPGVSPGR